MSDAAWAEVVSAIALSLLAAGFLFLGRRKVWVVTAPTVTYTRPDASGGAGISVTLDKGAVIPDSDVSAGLITDTSQYTRKSVSTMRLLLVGSDNRVSTSKAVALAWTGAIIFALFAIVIAKWLGDDTGYQSLVDNGLREEYWLLLGGPYAAAIAAKYATTSQAETGAKTKGAIDGTNVAQLVVNDEGNGDLGDFQYVAFNIVALAFFLGSFIPDLNAGMPEIPPVLTGLALTSAGTYSAKKFLQQAPPTLTSLIPTSVSTKAASTVEIWGKNLILPAGVTPDGTPRPPTVLLNGAPATVSDSQETMGSDRLTIQIPKGSTVGQLKVSAVRGDGVAATGPGGTDGLTLTVTP